MSVITTFPFTNPSNYTLNDTEVAGGVGRLALIDKPSQSFSQDFASDTGFTYNNAVSEFVAGVLRQKDQSAASSLLAAKYTSSIDLNWHKSGGSLTGTLNGAPTLSGGKLVCAGTQGVYYVANSGAIESHKFKYTPNYTGAPPANINIFSTYNGTNDNNRFALTHSPSGTTLRLTLNNASGGAVIGIATTLAGWSPTASQEYEFEVVINSTAGTVRVFVDGVLLGTNSPGAWTRGAAATRFYIGASPIVYNRAEGSFDDYISFTDEQHTTSYTPGYSVADTIYAADTISLPNFTYSGLGEIQTLDVLTTTEGNSPRFTVEGQYWNGSAWVASDGSYAQANSKATVNTNIATLDMSGQTVVSLQVVWQAQNLQASIDQLDLEYTGQFRAAYGTILTNASFVARDFIDFDADVTVPFGTVVRFVMCVNGETLYHNGSDWIASDLNINQANTVAEVQANIDSLLTVSSTVKVYIVFTATDQELTGEIDSMTLTYDFGAIEPSDPVQCQVFGFVKDSEDNPIVGAEVKVVTNRADDEYVEASDRIITSPLTRTTDASGFFSFNLIISSEYEVSGAQAMRYVLTVKRTDQTIPIFKNGGDGTTILFEVPNQASVNITDQIGAI